MSFFRVFGLSLWVACICVGLVNSQERAGELVGELPSENPVVFGGVEVCGPVYDALLFLGPKDESGKLDPSRIEPLPHLSGLFRAMFRPDADARVGIAGFAAPSVTLGDFKGNTQSVIATWNLGSEVGKGVFLGVGRKMRKDLGEPLEESDVFLEWKEGLLRTTLGLEVETGMTRLSYHCLPTEEEFWARVDAAPEPEMLLKRAESSEESGPPERLLGTPLLAVLVENGEPSAEPIRRDENTVGLYYEEYELDGIPCRMWVWLVDGETVYRGYKFAPPFGPTKAAETYILLSEAFSEWFGEPFTHIGGIGFDRIRDSWLNGPEMTTLTLEMADDHPWLGVEIRNREISEQIGADVTPGGKPIPRYIPPPKDSGKTRQDFVAGEARG